MLVNTPAEDSFSHWLRWVPLLLLFKQIKSLIIKLLGPLKIQGIGPDLGDFEIGFRPAIQVDLAGNGFLLFQQA